MPVSVLKCQFAHFSAGLGDLSALCEKPGERKTKTNYLGKDLRAVIDLANAKSQVLDDHKVASWHC